MTEIHSHLTPSIKKHEHTFFVYQPFGSAFALSEDEDLLYTPLMEDGSYSVNMDEYSFVEIDTCDEDIADTLIWIHSHLVSQLS